METLTSLMSLIIKGGLVLPLVLVFGVCLGLVVIILWDSRMWCRRIISILAPSVIDAIHRPELRRAQDHEYLVSRVMQNLERRKYPLEVSPDKERRLVTSIRSARDKHVKHN